MWHHAFASAGCIAITHKCYAAQPPKHQCKPHLICAGPNTLVGLAKKEGVSRTDLVKRLLPAYSQVLKELKSLGVPEVQIHEPILTVADAAELESDFNLTFAEFEKSGLYINLVTYYDDIGSTYPWVIK